MRDTINSITLESHPTRMRFKWKVFGHFIWGWLFGGALAFIPTTISFFRQPVENLSFFGFFKNAEIIYICITMAIIVLSESGVKKTILGFWVNLILVIIGIALYSNNDRFPILAVGNNLSILNLCLLTVVILFGFIHYFDLTLHIKREYSF